MINRQNINTSNLYTKEECPNCHFSFIGGFDPNNRKQCSSCKQIFQSGEKVDHGPGCSICLEKYHKPNIRYNNNHPPLMSDGRFLTYYGSTNELADGIRKVNGINCPNEFRKFMQDNGDKLIEAERNTIEKENTFKPNSACCEGWHDLWNKYEGNWDKY